MYSFNLTTSFHVYMYTDIKILIIGPSVLQFICNRLYFQLDTKIDRFSHDFY